MSMRVTVRIRIRVRVRVRYHQEIEPGEKGRVVPKCVGLWRSNRFVDGRHHPRYASDPIYRLRLVLLPAF